MNLKYFKLETREKILIAYFDNSSRSNAFGIGCAKEFHKIIKHIKKHKIEGFLLTSDQRIFCSGGNLSDYAKLKTKSQGIKINKEIAKILNEFSKMTVPTICLINGDCLGGGIEWVTAFDTIYATPSAFFGMWQRRIGLSWGWGGGHRLKMRISKKNLLNWVLNANNFSSYKAQEIGLVDAIHASEIIFERGLDFLKKQKDLPNIPFSKIKSTDLVSHITKNEQRVFQSLWMNPEHQRLLSKFR